MEILRIVLAERLLEERERIGYNRAGFARQLDITTESLRRYEMGITEAGMEFLAKVSKFGVDVQYVLTGIRSTNIEKVERILEPSLKIESGASANIIQNANAGSIINFNQKYTHTTKVEAKPNDSHISDQQKAILTKLVNDIAELEQQLKQKPKSHRSVWMALNAHCKVTSYHLIAFDDYEKAEKYLRMWIGRLSSQKSAPIADNEEWRKRKYAYIKINTKNQQEWIDTYLQRNFKTKSLSDLTDSELDKTYRAVASKRQKTKKESGFTTFLILFCLASASLAWIFAIGANYISSIDYMKSMILAIPAAILWSLALIVLICVHVQQKILGCCKVW